MIVTRYLQNPLYEKMKREPQGHERQDREAARKEPKPQRLRRTVCSFY